MIERYHTRARTRSGGASPPSAAAIRSGGKEDQARSRLCSGASVLASSSTAGHWLQMTSNNATATLLRQSPLARCGETNLNHRVTCRKVSSISLRGSKQTLTQPADSTPEEACSDGPWNRHRSTWHLRPMRTVSLIMPDLSRYRG